MNNRRRTGKPVTTGLALAAILAVAGCEQSQETLNVEPPVATIGAASNTVQFRVTGEATNATFATPITWTVSNPDLGEIVSSSGFAALYVGRSGTVGDNIVTARDNLDNEGYATVRRIDDTIPSASSATSSVSTNSP